ncbi:MAG: hypothetical protein ACXVRJ_08805 [Gaiellaceae bacterium]
MARLLKGDETAVVDLRLNTKTLEIRPKPLRRGRAEAKSTDRRALFDRARAPDWQHPEFLSPQVRLAE